MVAHTLPTGMGTAGAGRQHHLVGIRKAAAATKAGTGGQRRNDTLPVQKPDSGTENHRV